MKANSTIYFLSAHPDEPYFVWQTDVYLSNFEALGIPLQHCIALFGIAPRAYASPELQALRLKFPLAGIHLHYDTRKPREKDYPPSIQPHLIRKFLGLYPEYEKRLVLYHDCDIVFQDLPKFWHNIDLDLQTCYLSDTDDYIGYEYLHKRCELMRKENPAIPKDELILRMCKVVGIDIEEVKKNKGGGAQYLLQGLGSAYWDKVLRDSIALHYLFLNFIEEYALQKSPNDYLQIWTAGMWAYLWNIWFFKKRTIIHPELKFLFAGDFLRSGANILHMAGLQKKVNHLHFNKTEWREASPITTLKELPFIFDHYTPGSVSASYVNWIKAAAEVELLPLQTHPARQWRLLVMGTREERKIWEIEYLKVQLPETVYIKDYFDSNETAKTNIPALFNQNDQYWTGLPKKDIKALSLIFLGFELNKAAIPEIIKIRQRDNSSASPLVLLQFKNLEGQWNSSVVSLAHKNNEESLIAYHSSLSYQAKAWRVLARETNSKFAWDIERIKFMYNNQENTGIPINSNYAKVQDLDDYFPENAFQERERHWGGRPDKENLFWLGYENPEMTSVNRIVLEQGEDHFASSLEVQRLGEDHQWQTIYYCEGLTAGLSDIILFE